MTTFFARDVSTESVDLGEDAAHHARVKRLAPGDPVKVTDGEGRIGAGRIEVLGKSGMRVAIRDLRGIL